MQPLMPAGVIPHIVLHGYVVCVWQIRSATLERCIQLVLIELVCVQGMLPV